MLNMSLKKHSISILFILLTLLSLLYIYKLKGIHPSYVNKKKIQFIKKITVDLPLKNIYDRNGYKLAFSVAKYSYFLDTTLIKNQQELKQISEMFHYDFEKLLTKYKKSKKFVWLKRKSIRRIMNPFRSVFEVIEYSRSYPYGKMISHIIGVRNKENEPLGGLELFLNEKLQTGKKIIKFFRTADDKRLLLTNFNYLTSQNDGITTTLDIKLQLILDSVAHQAYEKWQPENLVAIVVQPHTGEILAWSQIPTFNPQTYNHEPLEYMRNIALTSPIEPGSLFKPFFYYTVLKEKKADENTIIFCENGHYRIRARHIYDHTPHANLTAKEVIAYSSNIGITKLSQRLEKEKFFDTLKTFGFLEPISIGFNNELKTKITPFNKWSYHTLISLPMGYEILTTPFHLLRAYASFLNGGYLVNLSLLKNEKSDRKKVLESEIIPKVKEALRLVTEIGTAKRANSSFYVIAGKTGTSKLLGQDGRYTASEHRSFFIGFAPYNNPALVVYFQLDKPKGAYFGGTVAAPYVKEFLEKSLQKLYIEFEKNENRRNLSKTQRK
jgi:cell division protein FtsI/penicillin-binding protein 2